MTPENPALERARQYVKDVRDFYYHLMTYVLVGTMLVVLDVRAGGEGAVLGLDWAYWVIIFWGLGVAGHAVSAFFGEYRVHKLYLRQQDREPGSG